MWVEDQKQRDMSTSKLYFMDNLKWFIIWLMVVFYAAMCYMTYAPEWWYVVDTAEPSILATAFVCWATFSSCRSCSLCPATSGFNPWQGTMQPRFGSGNLSGLSCHGYSGLFSSLPSSPISCWQAVTRRWAFGSSIRRSFGVSCTSRRSTGTLARSRRCMH